MTRVGHLEVEGQVPVVFVIPPREDDEDGRLLLVAGLDTIARWGLVSRAYSMFLRFLIDLM